MMRMLYIQLSFQQNILVSIFIATMLTESVVEKQVLYVTWPAF